MRILVTGGAGFIGSTLIRQLIQINQFEVINVDSLTYSGNLASLQSIEKNKNYIFEQCDICDFSKLKKIFEKYQPNLVFHLAAESHVDRSIENPDLFLQTNILGTANVLNASLQLWNANKSQANGFIKLIHISTDEVFGDLGEEEGLFDEDYAYNPSSPYAASKASADHLVRSWGRTYGLPYIISNCSNNYGPFQFPEKLIPHTVINALLGNKIPVYGNGSQVRDWLYVDDHADALINIAKSAEPMQSFAIGGKNEQQNLEVVNLICTYLDCLIDTKPNGISSFSDQILFVSDRPGHDIRYAINPSKIEADLGWYPQESFQTGLTKTLDWYLQRRDWWEPLLTETSLNMRRKI